MFKDNLYMRRCFDLARLGIGKVNPNPMVGSLLLYEGEVIGEGNHQQFGKAHAEVNCFRSVLAKNKHNINKSTLFVTLEPCCFTGKTPACTDLIIDQKVKALKISTIDKTPKVDGMGLTILKNDGVVIDTDILKKKGDWFVRFRTNFVTKKRPYVILKYAVSKDGFLGQRGKSIWMTNSVSKRLVHKWRSEVGAIMVGTNTALTDNPRLDNRYFHGGSPLRIVPDRQNRIAEDAHLKDGSSPTWILGNSDTTKTSANNLDYMALPDGDDFLPALFDRLVEANIDVLLVEGGAGLLNSFIEAGFWEEARIFETAVILGEGIRAPILKGETEVVEMIGNDRLVFHYREEVGNW